MSDVASSSPPPSPSDAPRPASTFDPLQVTRPAPVLLKYYLLCAVFSGPAFPLVALLLYFKYETLKYEFREDGVSMSWGILFRQEIHLTYRRIQDIHLTRNILQRWMGLATVSVQTASGSSMPEMSLEGILEAEALRDFLYSKMRGGTAEATPRSESSGDVASTEAAASDEALGLLREIRDLTRRLAERRGEVA